jgi:hypothetical protein
LHWFSISTTTHKETAATAKQWQTYLLSCFVCPRRCDTKLGQHLSGLQALHSGSFVRFISHVPGQHHIVCAYANDAPIRDKQAMQHAAQQLQHAQVRGRRFVSSVMQCQLNWGVEHISSFYTVLPLAATLAEAAI